MTLLSLLQIFFLFDFANEIGSKFGKGHIKITSAMQSKDLFVFVFMSVIT